MAQQHAYLEEISSQIPALQLLVNMGWQYLSPDEALILRSATHGVKDFGKGETSNPVRGKRANPPF